VLATLRAGSLTEDGRALLRSGRLTEELEPPGFEALAGLDIPTRPPRPVPEPKEARRRVRDLRRKLGRLETRAEAAERRAAELRKQLEAAEAEASRLDEERRGVEEELAAAEDDLEEAT
jgi:septal ring factor EnvC (AmiA/AmiB activator)